MVRYPDFNSWEIFLHTMSDYINKMLGEKFLLVLQCTYQLILKDKEQINKALATYISVLLPV